MSPVNSFSDLVTGKLSVANLPPDFHMHREESLLPPPDGRLRVRFRFTNDGDKTVSFLPDLRLQTDTLWLRPICATSFTATAGGDYRAMSCGGSSAIPRKSVIEYGPGFYRGSALGGIFGQCAGDCVEYDIPTPAGPHRKLILHLRGHGVFALGGIASGEIEPDTDAFTFCTIPLGTIPGGRIPFSLTCLSPGSLQIDAVFAADTPIRPATEAPYFYPSPECPGAMLLPLRQDVVLRLSPSPEIIHCQPGETAEAVFHLQNN